MLSKYHDLQKILFEEIVFDDDFCKILKLQNDVKENDDFKNSKMYKIYQDLNDTRDVIRVYVCMYAYMHACMHIRMYVCMHACIYVCIRMFLIFW